MRTLKFKAKPTNAFFRYCQSNVQRLLPASDYCRARGNQIVEHSSDNETVLGSSRWREGSAENLIDGSEKRTVEVPIAYIIFASIPDDR